MNGRAPAATARLFLALWPDKATRDAIAAWQRRWTWPERAAVVGPERLHLTLHFIGQLPRARLAEVSALLAVPHEPFEIAFGRAECWPRGLALLMPQSLPEALRALHRRLAAALAAAALPVDTRPFQPHCTLARQAVGAIPPPEPPALRWPVNGYALVESGRGYRVLQRYGG